MAGYIDLHSHWVAGIDDGARTPDDGYALLTALRKAGFEHVVATPHMRPGMFDNARETILRAFGDTARAIGVDAARPASELPTVSLSSEHFFDDVVYERLMSGTGVVYPGGHAVLIELSVTAFPARLQHRLYDLRKKNLTPVIAHPERYEPVWRDIRVLDPLLDAGAVLLMDVAALEGKYGRAPRKAAEALLGEGYYYAACSDAHRATDVEEVAEGIQLLFKRAGEEEATFLLREGPKHILEGRIER
ncbi:MAG: protein tyrosine phosphatase [Polyangiaceae bacterium]|nr:protein tyrosine phosphatase [Polyangiaceae bacterium]